MAIVYYEACALSSNMSKRYDSERKYERQKTKLNYYKEGEMFDDAPSPRYARERATLVLLRFVRSDWSWESDLLNQALQPHGAGNTLRGTEMGSERTLALL